MNLPRTLLDAYVGCGGFSLGAKWAGFRTELAIDIDPILTSSFSINFPGTRLLLRDIASLKANEIAQLLPNGVDGVIGGPPCQPFSENGAREPDDPRRDLVAEFFRIVAIVRPTFFIMENVRGLDFTRNRPVLDAALGRLTGSWTILEAHLDASDFGAATRRRRLFVFGFDPAKMTPPDLECVRRQENVRSTVRDAIGDLVGAKQIEQDKWRYDARRRVSAYSNRLRSSNGTFSGHRFTDHRKATIGRFAKVRPGEWDNVGKHPRLAWNRLCPALLAGTGMDRGAHQSVRPIHPDDNRVITVREAARIQGFPDDFVFHSTVWHSFRMIGNSVCPPIAETILTNILGAMGAPAVRAAAE